MANWYVNAGNGSSTGYYAVAQWAALHTYAANAIVRQLAAPATGSERCFQTALGGISAAAEPTWVLTAGSSSPTDGTVTDWKEITGQEAKQGTSGTWAAPFARTAPALASGWAAAGDTIYIASASAETQATAITQAYPGTVTAPNQLICVAQSTNIPPVAADVQAAVAATITTTGVSSITITGCFSASGTKWSAGSGSSNGTIFIKNSGTTTPAKVKLLNCALALGGTSTASLYNLGTTTANAGPFSIELENTTLSFANASQTIEVQGGDFTWKNTASALAGAAVPTTLFTNLTQTQSNVMLDGLDLSAAGSGKTLIGTNANASRSLAIIRNCKLNAAVTVAATPGAITANRVWLDVSDSSASTGRGEVYLYGGTRTTELTVVKSGGASDGSTAFSWKSVTNGNNGAVFPYVVEDLWQWVSAASHTVALDILSSTTLTNAQVWMEVQFLGVSGAPQSQVISTGIVNQLTAGTNIPSSGASWTTSGVGTPNAQIMTTASFTTQQAGYIRIAVKCATASLTFYVDPLPQVT